MATDRAKKAVFVESDFYHLHEDDIYVKLARLMPDNNVKQAQSLSDKIVNSPTAQQAIRDGIAKALSNKADDWSEEHEEIKENIKNLDDHVLFEFCKMFQEEIKARGLDTEEYEEAFEEEEVAETAEDEAAEEEELKEVMAYVKVALTKLAESCADDGEVESAYLIERTLDRLNTDEV